MCWNACGTEEGRMRFVADYRSGILEMNALCEAYDISRVTGYKWIERFEAEGIDGLKDRSRAPHNHPNATPVWARERIIAERLKRPTWGARKLKGFLEHREDIVLPVESTIGEMLRKEGLTVAQKKRRHVPPYTNPFEEADRPNRVWCVDFKGDFHTKDGRHCYPLTMQDAYSRFLLDCRGLHRTSFAESRPVFEQAFRTYGIPDFIKSDNGSPFASIAVGGLTHLSAWWIKLGIRPERIAPAHPEQNGRLERFHRTLKAETIKPPKANFPEQQQAFDTFREEYNEIRPHEALGMRTPSDLYLPSDRPFDPNANHIVYPGCYNARLVKHSGEICLSAKRWYVSEAVAREHVGLKTIADGLHEVYFGPVFLCYLDESQPKVFRKLSRKRICELGLEV